MTAIGNGAIASTTYNFMCGNSTVNGVYSTNGFSSTSDGRFKTNVSENVKGLEFINRLRPVIYNLDTKSLDDFLIQNMPDSIKTKHQEGMDFGPSTSKVHSGFIAQEVEQAAQEVGYISSIVTHPVNSNEAYALRYEEIVVPLVKAVQQLSHTVDSLKNVGHSSMRMGNTGTNNDSLSRQDIKLRLPDGATLGEPQPNPNSGSTQIPYYLPQNTSGAKIIFTDMLGKVMEERTLQPGYGLLNIDTQDLPAGVYSYSLIVNGKVIDNKKMMRNN